MKGGDVFEELEALGDSSGAVSALAINADATILATGGESKLVELWNIEEAVPEPNIARGAATVANGAETLLAASASAVHLPEEAIRIDRVGDRFLRRMVRTLVASAVRAARHDAAVPPGRDRSGARARSY